MTDRLLVSIWGITINAEGIWAIGAAVLVVLVVAFARRKRI